MTSWHQGRCGGDVVVASGDCIFCQKCDSWAPEISTEECAESLPPIPDPRRIGKLNLRWPVSVEYVDDDTPQEQIDGRRDEYELNTVLGHHELQPSRVAGDDFRIAPTHPPLPHVRDIRLLHLSPGSGSDPLHGSLVSSNLDDRNTEFEAVSYTWSGADGDKSQRNVIYLGPRWDVYRITANCHAALSHFRFNDHGRVLWIDSVCIDQGNHAERNQQVRMMGQIYASASVVLAYLGDKEGEDLSAGLDMLMGGSSSRLDPISEHSLQQLFSQTYFQRVWVIQEIANARAAQLHYRSQCIGWSLLSRRFQELQVLGAMPSWVHQLYGGREDCEPDGTPPGHIPASRSLRSTADLADLLLMALGCHASDPRDMVFALLGLLQDGGEVNADYTLSIQEVYIGIGAFLLTKYRATHLLQYTGKGLPRMLTSSIFDHVSNALPTWVPNWLLGWSSSTSGFTRLRDKVNFRYPDRQWFFLRPGQTFTMPSTVREQRIRVHTPSGALSLFVHVVTKCWKTPKSGAEPYYWESNTGQSMLIMFEVNPEIHDIVAWVDGCDVFLHLRNCRLLGNCVIALSDFTLPPNEDLRSWQPADVASFTDRLLPLLKKEWEMMKALELNMNALLSVGGLPKCSDTMPTDGYKAYVESSIFHEDNVILGEKHDALTGLLRLKYWDSLVPVTTIREFLGSPSTTADSFGELWRRWRSFRSCVYGNLLRGNRDVLSPDYCPSLHTCSSIRCAHKDGEETVVEGWKKCTVKLLKILERLAGRTVSYIISIEDVAFDLTVETVDFVFHSLCEQLEPEIGSPRMRTWDLRNLVHDFELIAKFEESGGIPGWIVKHPWRQLMINLFLRKQSPQLIVIQ